MSGQSSGRFPEPANIARLLDRTARHNREPLQYLSVPARRRDPKLSPVVLPPGHLEIATWQVNSSQNKNGRWRNFGLTQVRVRILVPLQTIRSRENRRVPTKCAARRSYRRNEALLKPLALPRQ